MSKFSEIKKIGKIKLYAKKLPYNLKKRFGKKASYSQMEVDQALADNFVDTVVHSAYAYAMFCNHSEFQRICKEQQFGDDYNAMRLEIAEICFRRPTEFVVDDIMEYSSGDWAFDTQELDDVAV
ncbi:MAG: hypothetical protein OEZ68_14070 [Gammaproteobacteria bacterium]|nr:hypothetical protein [Gammaproteobacteria bacterium]MDH5801929.1 hypothetical protein [Gammaproteobacteria bacterium]